MMNGTHRISVHFCILWHVFSARVFSVSYLTFQLLAHSFHDLFNSSKQFTGTDITKVILTTLDSWYYSAHSYSLPSKRILHEENNSLPNLKLYFLCTSWEYSVSVLTLGPFIWTAVDTRRSVSHVQ